MESKQEIEKLLKVNKNLEELLRINKNLHIFIKYNEDTGIVGKLTMSEHLKICLEKGEVAWGHFTNTKPSRNKKGLWSERTKYLDSQLENDKTTLVFFYCRKSQELYVGDLLNYYDREEPDTNKELIELIPKYYHDRIGSINEKTDINTMRSYAFVIVTNLRKIDFNDTDYIYNFKGENEKLGTEKVLESKGMASLLYVNLDQKFYDKLTNNIQSIVKTSIIKEKDFFKEGALEEDKVPPTSKIMDGKESISNTSPSKREGSRKGRKHSIENDIKNKGLGYIGERLVLNLEKQRVLEQLGQEYVDKIEHTSQTDDEKGYDILSWEKLDNGNIIEKYIEVKTTEGGKLTQFFISSGEVKFSAENKEQYYLYRVYNYDKKTGDAKYFIKNGSIEEIYNLVPKNYAVYLK